MANVLKGIDVSYANRHIDWNKAKKEIDFAIIRSTFGSDLPSQTDRFFNSNVDGCIKNKVPFGLYHFAYFVDEKTAKDEADFVIKKANDYMDYVKFIALDVEEDSVRYAINMVKGNAISQMPDWTKCAVAFLERVKQAGYTPVLYTNQAWIENIYNYEKLKGYKLWYAAPGVGKPKYDPAIWQYSWVGKVSGIVGDVDMDYLYDESLINKKTTTSSASPVSSNITANKKSGLSDRDTFIEQAKKYIGVDGDYVCNQKLNLCMIVDWCAYSISAIMQDCGFIGKYQGGIYGFASDAAREDNGKYGEWFKKGEKSPLPGDYIMFKYASFTNPLDKYSASHVGIVESVNGDILTTLEGNVDGSNYNWAATSSFKRKTRYLSSADVYSFYRPYWQNNTSSGGASNSDGEPVTSNPSSTNTSLDVVYQVYTDGRWLPWVTNLADFAGLENKSIQGVRISVSGQKVKYRVKLVNGDWLPWITDYNTYNENGYAGIKGRNIDCIQIYLPDTQRYKVSYRVSTTNSTNYLDWVQDYNNNNSNGYAGIKGASIDKLQIQIIERG